MNKAIFNVKLIWSGYFLIQSPNISTIIFPLLIEILFFNVKLLKTVQILCFALIPTHIFALQ